MSIKPEINVFIDQPKGRVKIAHIPFTKKNQWTLLSYQKLKRIILKFLGFSSSNLKDINLSILGVYKQLPQISTPIYNDSNLQLLLELVIQNTDSIAILLAHDKQLTKKQKRKPQIPIQFDSDGSVDSAEDQVDILPQRDRYRGDDLVKCQFCHHSNREKSYLKYGGAFYGPYLKNNYAHYACAIWRPTIYISEKDQKLVNIQQNIKQGIKHPQTCFYCGKQGILLQCHANACKLKTHYICGLERCQFNMSKGKYNFLCHKCRNNEAKRKKLGWDISQKQTTLDQDGEVEQGKDQSKPNNSKIKTEMQIQDP